MTNSNPVVASDKYLIWSNEHNAWWKAGGWGYTPSLTHAGRYEKEAAIEICRKAAIPWSGTGPFNELPIREADIKEFANRWGK